MIYFNNIFQKISAKTTVIVFFVFCLFFVDNVFGWNLFSKKPLVVYFSNSGHTQVVAEKIQRELDADILRLETVIKYPKDQKAFSAQAKSEVEAKHLPALVNGNLDLSSYDVIVVGTPAWYGKASPAIMTFLTQNDLSGKMVYFFVTHNGDSGTAVEDMKATCPNSVHGSALKIEFRSSSEDTAIAAPNNTITKWASEIKDLSE